MSFSGVSQQQVNVYVPLCQNHCCSRAKRELLSQPAVPPTEMHLNTNPLFIVTKYVTIANKINAAVWQYIGGYPSSSIRSYLHQYWSENLLLPKLKAVQRHMWALTAVLSVLSCSTSFYNPHPVQHRGTQLCVWPQEDRSSAVQSVEQKVTGARCSSVWTICMLQ